MSQKTMILAIKEASRKIQLILEREGRVFHVEVKDDLDKEGNPRKHRGPRMACLTTQPMALYLAEELRVSIEEVLTLIQHIEPFDDSSSPIGD